MRSGVIAQKLGMTRIFTDAGEHVPVTVLKLDDCQVVAQRTAEKNGYTAAAARRRARPRSRTSRRPSAAISPRPRSSRSASSPSSASTDDELIPVGAEITADHFVAGQFVDVTGTTIGKGFAGAHEALELRRSARHPRRLGLAPFARFDRQPPGSGQDLQEQEDGRPHGRRARHHAEPASRADRRRARPDPGRGRGARRQGRLDPRPRRGQARAAEGCAAARASSAWPRRLLRRAAPRPQK